MKKIAAIFLLLFIIISLFIINYYLEQERQELRSRAAVYPLCPGTCYDSRQGCPNNQYKQTNDTCLQPGYICCVLDIVNMCQGLCKVGPPPCPAGYEDVDKNCQDKTNTCCMPKATPTPSPVRYSCQLDGSCSLSATGFFSSLIDCQVNCDPNASPSPSPSFWPSATPTPFVSPSPTPVLVCAPGEWGSPQCGGQGCGSCYSPQCNSAGAGWNCVWNPGLCCNNSDPSPTPSPGSGPSPSPAVLAQCQNIKYYQVNGPVNDLLSWSSPLTSTELKYLQPGNVIYITTLGSVTNGQFDRARIRVNRVGDVWFQSDETTDVKPKANPADTSEFYKQYTLPQGVISFTVEAEIHEVIGNRWY